MLAALEVSTRICSVALLDLDSGEVAASLSMPDDMESSQTLLPALQDLLKQKRLGAEDLTAIAVSVGPGSFTGIRVGISTAQGLALPGNIPCYGISSLDGLAENLRSGGWEGEALALIDAQRGECFAGHYQIEASGFRKWEEPRILMPADFALVLQGRAWIVGPGALKQERAIRESLGTQGLFAMTAFHRPSALSIARLAFERWRSGERPDAGSLQPLYLRQPAADEKRDSSRGPLSNQ